MSRIQIHILQATQTSNSDRAAVVPLTLTYPFNSAGPVFNNPSQLYDEMDITPGTVVSQESDIFATDADNDNVKYDIDLSSNSNADKFKLESFPDGSVKIIYTGNLMDDTLINLVIRVLQNPKIK